MKRSLQAENNSLFSNSLFIFLIRFFPSLANVLVVILFSRNLGTSEYGLYQGFWTHLFVCSAIACMGAQTFLLTYAPDAIKALLKKLPSAFRVGFIIWILLLSSLFAWTKYDMLGIGWLIPFLFIAAYSLSVIAESLLIVFRSFRLLFWINLLYTLFFCFFHWLLIKGACSWQALFIGLLVLCLVRLLIYLIPVRNQLKRADPSLEIDSFTGYRSLWLHLGVYDISQILFRWIDKYLVSLIVSSQLFAIYFNGSIDIPFLPLLLGAVGGAGLMKLAAHKKGDSVADEVMLQHQSGRLLSCIVFPLFFFFVFFRYEVFSVVLTTKYAASVPIFLMSVMAIPLRAYSFTTILQSRQKGAAINVGAVFDLLLACVLMYPLYRWIGLPGVALSFVISSYMQAVFYLYRTAGLLNVGILTLVPYKNWLVKLIIFAALFISIHYILSDILQPQFVLLWGAVLAIVVSMLAIFAEYKISRRDGSEF